MALMLWATHQVAGGNEAGWLEGWSRSAGLPGTLVLVIVMQRLASCLASTYELRQVEITLTRGMQEATP